MPNATTAKSQSAARVAPPLAGNAKLHGLLVWREQLVRRCARADSWLEVSTQGVIAVSSVTSAETPAWVSVKSPIGIEGDGRRGSCLLSHSPKAAAEAKEPRAARSFASWPLSSGNTDLRGVGAPAGIGPRLDAMSLGKWIR